MKKIFIYMSVLLLAAFAYAAEKNPTFNPKSELVFLVGAGCEISTKLFAWAASKKNPQADGTFEVFWDAVNQPFCPSFAVQTHGEESKKYYSEDAPYTDADIITELNDACPAETSGKAEISDDTTIILVNSGPMWEFMKRNEYIFDHKNVSIAFLITPPDELVISHYQKLSKIPDVKFDEKTVAWINMEAMANIAKKVSEYDNVCLFSISADELREEPVEGLIDFMSWIYKNSQGVENPTWEALADNFDKSVTEYKTPEALALLQPCLMQCTNFGKKPDFDRDDKGRLTCKEVKKEDLDFVKKTISLFEDAEKTIVKTMKSYEDSFEDDSDLPDLDSED